MAVSKRTRYEVLRRDNHTYRKPLPVHVVRPVDTTEEWRWVPGFEGLYEVSDLGYVRSVGRLVVDSRGIARWFRGRELRNTREGNPGYVKLSLYRDGVRHVTRLHVLVAAAFLGERPRGAHVAHNDGNPCNNRADNLRYATAAANLRDRSAHGTDNRGVRNGHARLDEHQVQIVRNRLREGERQVDIAASLGVARTTVSAIATGRSWRSEGN